MSIRIYAVTMGNGDIYGVPAEVIADHYAKYHESRGESYQDNFNAMIGWFDAVDFEFEDWAKNNMDWDDVKDKAFLLEKSEQKVDFQDGWVNGHCEFKRYGEEGELHAGSMPLPESYHPNICAEADCPYNDGKECPAAEGCGGDRMTEQEAEIKRVVSYIRSCREAGIDTTITIDKSRNHLILNALEEIQQYRALGTVEELREAVEKQRAKKPVNVKGDVNGVVHKCPNCGADYNRFYEGKPHCMFCGQAIDWSEE